MRKAGDKSLETPSTLEQSRSPVRRLLRLWQKGTQPDILAFLASEGDLDTAQVAEILRADQRKRWRAGSGVPAEWYLEHFPALLGEHDLALDLIHSEFLLREALGQSPDLKEYVARFPRFAESIEVQVAFHCALDAVVGAPESPVGEQGWSGTDASAPMDRLARANRTRPGNLPTIPGYEILRELGVGGMAVVYEAYQIRLKRNVALKMALQKPQSEPESVQRFQVEAEASASLHHPNIVEIYESGESQGRAYYSMELVEGGDLSQELASGPTSTRRAAQVTEVLARAIHYAHLRGILHRDLKPANVLITPERVPKIADFGLAKHLGGDSCQTQSGTILGSPCYMSPEQASGNIREAGPATDVYSLGAILYEMLTGSPPFRSRSPLDTFRKLLNEDPERPTRLRRKVPRDLETICLKCLEKLPRRRYASALELAEDLDRFLNFDSVRARPVTPPERVWRWCRRKTSLAIAMGLAALGAVTAIGLSIFLAAYHYQAASRIGEALQEVQSRRRQVDLMAADLAFDHGQAFCEQGDVAQGVLWLVRGLNTASQARDAALEGAFRRNLSGWLKRIHPFRARFDHPGPIHAVAFSPDGRIGATAGEGGMIWLWDVATGDPIGDGLPHPAKVGAMAFSPDGRTLLTGGEDSFARLWDVATGVEEDLTFPHESSVLGVAFSPDGGKVVTAGTDGTAQLWDAGTGDPIGRPMRHKWHVDGVAFSPDGRAVLTASWDKTAQLWDATTGAPIGQPLSHEDWVSSVAFSPDGKTLLTGSYDRTARLWDRETGRPIGEPFRHQHCVSAVAFAPDGRSILTGSYDGNARLWDAGSGRPLGALLRHQHTVAAVAFSPDGRLMLTGSFDKTARLWEVAKSDGLSFSHNGFIRAVIFSPDGKTILSASEDKTGRLWNASTGEPIGAPLSHTESVEAVAFSPDGRTALTGSYDGTARLWDATTGQPIGPPLRHNDRVKTVAFSPRGDVVVTGSDDKTARIWSRAGSPVGRPLPHGDKVRAVAFSPDGRLILTGSEDKTAVLWDTSDGALIGRPLTHQGKVVAVAFGPNGRTALTGSDDMKARLWDVATGKLLCPPLQHDGPVSVVAFSSDGRNVITGGWDRVARLWETSTGFPISPPLRHDGTLRALAISPDGRIVLTGSYDRTAQLWDKATGKPIGPAFRHENQVWFVAFSPDGRTVLSGGQEKTARLWHVPSALDTAIDRIDTDIQAITGMQLLEDGSLHILDSLEWSSYRKRPDTYLH
jgi:eukaryotic-like serine/threonine-protein kinase